MVENVIIQELSPRQNRYLIRDFLAITIKLNIDIPYTYSDAYRYRQLNELIWNFELRMSEKLS
jgi:hypothetical protein